MTDERMKPVKVAWYYRPVPLILLLIFLGPFAFAWLWRSPKFNLVAKISLAIATLIWTAYIVYLSMNISTIMAKYYGAIDF